MPKCSECVYATIRPNKEPHCSVDLKTIKDLERDHPCKNYHALEV